MDEKIYLPPPEAGKNFSLTKESVKGARRTFSRCFLFLAVYLVSAIALLYGTTIAIMIIFGPQRGEAIVGSLAYTWIMQVVAMYIVTFPLSYLIVRRVPKAKRKSSRITFEEFVVIFLISEGVMIVGSIISNIFTNLLSAILGYTVNNDTSDLITSTPVWIVILVAVIIGPIVEELIFRKIFIDRISVYGDRLAILISAVAFGVFHGNFSQVIYATGLGLILGYVYTKSGNVIYSLLLHVILNFIGTVPTLLVMDKIEGISAITDPFALTAEELATYYLDVITVFGVALIQYVLAFIGVGVFIYVLAKRLIKVPSHCEIALPGRTITKAVFLNVGTILFAVFVAFEFVLSVLP